MWLIWGKQDRLTIIWFTPGNTVFILKRPMLDKVSSGGIVLHTARATVIGCPVVYMRRGEGRSRECKRILLCCKYQKCHRFDSGILCLPSMQTLDKSMEQVCSIYRMYMLSLSYHVSDLTFSKHLSNSSKLSLGLEISPTYRTFSFR